MNPFVVNGRPTTLLFEALVIAAIAAALYSYDWGYLLISPVF